MKDKPKFCTKCGHTLTTSINFCANCGRKIDEMQEKEKPSISQEDFIKKYYGDKILDRIDEISTAKIGDEDRLFSIYEKIKKKKEFDADEIQYLMDCSEELDKKGTELPTNKKKISQGLLGDDPSSPLYTKGTFGFYGKRNVGKRIIGIAIVSGILLGLVGVVMLSDDSDSETEILEFVWNYKGKDNSGPTLGKTLAVILAVKYPGEDILENPSTTKYYFATPDYSKGTTSDRYWTVELELQTYDDKVYFKWFVDAETNSVQAGNRMAESILNILDTYDK